MARPVPADLEDALAANPAARETFWAMPPEQKDAWVAWVERARMPRARRRRVARCGAPSRRSRSRAEDRSRGPRTRLRCHARTGGCGSSGSCCLPALAAFLVWLTVYRHHDSKPSTVVVSAKATVPGVVGVRYQSAQFQLQQAKLASKLMHKAATKPKGIVLDQAPKAGTTVPQGTKVTLVVSNGPPGVAMPDVVGLAAADAVNALQARKLTSRRCSRSRRSKLPVRCSRSRQSPARARSPARMSSCRSRRARRRCRSRMSSASRSTRRRRRCSRPGSKRRRRRCRRRSRREPSSRRIPPRVRRSRRAHLFA